MSDVIERLTGESLESLREHEWPSARSSEQFFVWPGVLPRGNFRLATGLTIGADEVARRRQQTVTKLLEALPEA